MTDFSRRQLLQAGAGLALAGYGLGGCTVARQVDRSAAGRIIKPQIDGDLLIYNWAQYMDPQLKKGFEEKYGVTVTEVNYDNLEGMVIKLRSGAQYDLIWPSTEYVARLNAEGLLAQFDRGLLRNSDNLSSFYDSPGGIRTTSSEFPTPITRPESRGVRTSSRTCRAPGTTCSTRPARTGCSSSTTSRRRSERPT